MIVIAMALAAAGLSRATAEKVVKEHESEATACFTDAQQKTPDLAGRVALDIVIEPSGKVKSAHATPTPTYTDQASLKCIEDVAKSWHFPKGSARVWITYPFSFGNVAAAADAAAKTLPPAEGKVKVPAKEETASAPPEKSATTEKNEAAAAPEQKPEEPAPLPPTPGEKQEEPAPPPPTETQQPK